MNLLIQSHPEQAPRGRRWGGAQSKDPVEFRTDAHFEATGCFDSVPSHLRPRRNSAQHDRDEERVHWQRSAAGAKDPLELKRDVDREVHRILRIRSGREAPFTSLRMTVIWKDVRWKFPPKNNS